MEKIKVEFETNSTSINQTINKTVIDINTKIEESMKLQEERQLDSLSKVEDKFQKVINEIKSPLSID